ncbi:recombinase family protein [Candidatus Arsenophonus triatominarum]|uniref:recombinase family protein n=1 Tax=Candidatus Arsenophonus triatominarum TaxID=57911 RepID=UPI003CCB9F47
MARNLDDLRSLVKSLTEQGVSVEFIKENLIFTGEDSPMSNFLLSVMGGAFAEFERALIRERQLEGIAIAKNLQRTKKSLTQKQIQSLQSRAKNGKKKPN